MTAMEVVRITGVSQRTLNFWVSSGFIVPWRPAEGSGYAHEYDIPGVVKVQLAVMLRRIGLATSQIRPILEKHFLSSDMLCIDADRRIWIVPRDWMPAEAVSIVINLDELRKAVQHRAEAHK